MSQPYYEKPPARTTPDELQRKHWEAKTAAPGRDGSALGWVRVRRTTDQSIPNSAATTVNFASTYSISGTLSGLFDTSGYSKLTIATGGLYLVSGQVVFASDATGRRGVELLSGGSDMLAYVRQATVSGAAYGMEIHTVAYLDAGTDVSMRVLQTSGSSLYLSAYGYAPALTIVHLM